MALIVNHIHKTFGASVAVDDVSFTVQPGSVFGFLGTNGAGKTTTMRVILDILRPDRGSVTWNGVPNTRVPRQAWGYLPEERGLYPKMTVEDHLLYLAQLHDAPLRDARRALDEWLTRFEITENRTKRIEQLSKGNQQKVQFLAAILHDPQVLIFDEPFSGLDPVNAAMLKEAFREMQRRGKTLVFSTHQMEQAEELCEQIAVIQHGRLVLSGELRALKRASGRQIVRLALANDAAPTWFTTLPGVTVLHRRADYTEMEVAADTDPESILRAALAHGRVIRFEITAPSLNDLFLAAVGAVPASGSKPEIAADLVAIPAG